MKWLKGGAVIFGAVVITALGIDAADTLNGSSTTLLGQLAATRDGGCPTGMIAVATAVSFSCVDRFEASPSQDCPLAVPANRLESKTNVDDTDCGAASVEGTEPWRHITRDQAQLACTRSGKRLPTNEEWHLVAAGTPDSNDACNIDGNRARPSGAQEQCISAAGVFDAVGNVWEWTNEDVFDGEWDGRTLPEEGYVTQVDTAGVAALTGGQPSELFGEDYFWSKAEGAFAFMRGGFYGSQEDAGVYTAHAATPPTFAGPAIGFRCVK